MNQHYQEAQRLSAESSLVNEWGLTERLIIATRANTEATLALAHAQHTANLIAFNYVGGKMHNRDVHITIERRLGLGLKENQ